MTTFARKLAFSTALACLTLALGAAPALAKTAHSKHHTAKTHHVHHVTKKAKTAKGGSIVRIAQNHLANLGYYGGKIDGVMGSQTKSAIKRFQRDHGLKADGVLNNKTSAALEKADRRSVASTPMVLTHERVAPADMDNVNPDYAQSLKGGTKVVSSRFARVDVSESGIGASKRYLVNVNGAPILTADGQPSVIGISPTYDLGNEDAVIFTTYSPSDSTCFYHSYVLAMNGAGTKMLNIENCTRAYQAHVDNGSLYISFPEHDDARALGATWRVDGTNLERL